MNWSGKGVLDSEVAELSSKLRQTNSIKLLLLGSNCITSSGAKAVARVLEHQESSVTMLDLSNNSISHGVHALSSAYINNARSKLMELDLSANDLGDEGGVCINRMLRAHARQQRVGPGLTKVRLAYNKINEAGLLAVAEALETNSTLLSLDISGNVVCPVVVQAFERVLKHNTTLRALTMDSPLSLTHLVDDCEVDVALCFANLHSYVKRNAAMARFGELFTPMLKHSGHFDSKLQLSLGRRIHEFLPPRGNVYTRAAEDELGLGALSCELGGESPFNADYGMAAEATELWSATANPETKLGMGIHAHTKDSSSSEAALMHTTHSLPGGASEYDTNIFSSSSAGGMPLFQATRAAELPPPSGVATVVKLKVVKKRTRSRGSVAAHQDVIIDGQGGGSGYVSRTGRKVKRKKVTDLGSIGESR
jgi:hypothetical protein